MTAVDKDRVDELFNRAMELPSVKSAFQRLRDEKVSSLIYHNEDHTIDVMREAALFGLAGELSEPELNKLLIAAAWHDVGFVEGRENHEETSVRLFVESLMSGECPEVQSESVEEISQMIRDTKIFILPHGAGSEQKANTPLSKYLLDADLSNLGRDDFFTCLEQLLKENQLPVLDYHIAALGLISRHRWHTKVAEELRLAKEMENAKSLVERIKGLTK